jgi:hypothetical protein
VRYERKTPQDKERRARQRKNRRTEKKEEKGIYDA